MRRLLNLVKLPFRGRPPVGTTPADVVLRENKWRLLRYRAPEGASATPRFRTPLLLVPSLINRHYVLDLLPGKSFAGWMVEHGHDVYIIDWGTPGAEDRYLTLDTIADGYIGRALRHVARSSPRGQAHVLGYCLGGTLAAIHAAARPEHVASLTAMAAPIRFADAGIMATWTRSPAFSVDALVDAFGNVPWPLMQLSFKMLRPTLDLAKAVNLVDRAWNDEFLDGFLALETWGSDNVSFPGEAYRRYIKALYQADELVHDRFTLSGRPVRLANITCPTLAVTFEHDHIVPAPSAAVLIDKVGAADKQLVHMNGGHVGAVVSKSAAHGLWPRLSAFWAERDVASDAAVTDEPARAPVGAPASSAPAAAPATSAPRGPRSRRPSQRP